MSSSRLLDRLVEALQAMPGIGPVSATRIAYNLLDRRREDALRISDALKEAAEHVALCPDCRNYCDSEGGRCSICSDFHRRDSGLLCVVESPMDVESFEQSGAFHGTYFVLHGHLSPIDGVGPEELGLDALGRRLDEGGVREMILALGQSAEGEATAQYLAAMARRRGIPASGIATGIPMGGDIQSVDGLTLTTSLENRRRIG